MKIAYITLHWPRNTASGVGKKIIRQTEEWRRNGHEVRYFSHLHSTNDEEKLVEGEQFFFPEGKGIIQRELGRIIAAKKLLKSVKNYAPDIIYLRWGMYTAPMRHIFSIGPVVLEINTNDKQEHKHLGLALDLYNRATRSFFLRSAKGLVFTSRELTSDQDFTHYIDQFEVISNGINLKGIPFYPAPVNKTPRLVFLGTPGMAWQGINELVRFAAMNPDITIDIVGSDRNDITNPIPSNLILHGYLEGSAFENILSQADAAIGSISLHLKGMEEASPLKIRDCAGRGIPCILPYTDTDLSGIQCEAILQIPNVPGNLTSYSKIVHDFIFDMRGKRIAREEVAEAINIAEKECKRLTFFQQIIDQT